MLHFDQQFAAHTDWARCLMDSTLTTKVVMGMTWKTFATRTRLLGFDEIRLVGAASPQVARAMRAALEDVKSVAPPGRQAPLDRQLDLLSSAVEREFDDDLDSEAAMLPDGLGIGSGPDLIEREPVHR